MTEQIIFIFAIICFGAGVYKAAVKRELDWTAAGLCLFAIAIYLA